MFHTVPFLRVWKLVKAVWWSLLFHTWFHEVSDQVIFQNIWYLKDSRSPRYLLLRC